jgi:hypothetical protein
MHNESLVGDCWIEMTGAFLYIPEKRRANAKCGK